MLINTICAERTKERRLGAYGSSAGLRTYVAPVVGLGGGWLCEALKPKR